MLLPGLSPQSQSGVKRFSRQLTLCALACLAAGWIGSAKAGERTFDFNPPNGDPAKNGFILFGSNAGNAWHTNGGFTGLDGDGFLEITPALNNATLGVLFPLDYFTNADNSLTALPLKGFFLEADVRIGNATGNNGRPADGFNISFATSQDPVVFWGKQGTFRAWAGGDSVAQALEPTSYNYATGVGAMDPAPCDSATAENGTKTGVSVQFDTWQGNTIIDQNGTAPAAGNDNVGWRVHYNGKMIARIQAQPPTGPLAQSPDPTGADVNGLAVCPAANAPTDYTQDTNCLAAVLADTNSIQTGPYYTDDNDGSTHSGSFTNLGWAHLSVELTTNTPHLLTVKFKGRTLVDNVALTNFAPYVGQIIMGGRTGGANENRDVDNVHLITYPSVQSVFTGISTTSGYLTDFTIGLANIGPAKVTTVNSLTLDGVEIKASPNTVITIGDPNSTIKFHSPTNLPSGGAHSVIVNWSDAGGNTQSQSAAFSTLNWVTLPAADAVPASSIDLNAPGFLVQAYQTASGQPNRMYWTDEQLMGLHGTNWLDFSTLTTTNGEIVYGDVIDFANAGAGGQFPNNNDWTTFNIPGAGLANDDNSSIAVSTYLYFPAPGTYILGGNSDDGLRVTFAKNSHDLLGTRVPGLFADVGRGIGSLQNLGAVIVTNAGYYGFRLLWENGGGGSAIEWYTTSTPAGVTNVLINDVGGNPDTAIKAYWYSSAAPPYISYAEPPLDDDQVFPSQALKYKISDASTTVAAGTVALKVNGAAQSPTVSTASGVTTVSLPAPTTFWPTGTNSVELSFKDSAGTNYDYKYNFIVPAYASSTLNVTQSVPLGSQDSTKPGFVLQTAQIDYTAAGDSGDGSPNQSDYANALIAGLWFPTYGSNASSVKAATTWTGPIDFAINGSQGDFTNDFAMPGIIQTNTSATDNIGALFQFWLAFPTAGTFLMGVSSDDGFRLSEGFDHLRQVLHVNGTGIDKDVGAVVSTTVDGNGGFGAVLPVTPISAPVVFVNSNTPLSSVSGKIVAVDRALFGLSDADLVFAAQTNGALAAIVINQPANGMPGGPMTGTPTGTNATITIPALTVSGRGSDRALWTNANLTASIGASQAIELGGADYGKGMGWINFSVTVPAPGLYPMNLIWYNGGGGAGIEFASYQPDGTRILVNDPSNPNSLKAFRAVTAGTPAPVVSIARSGGTVTITYTGTLQSSSKVNGPYVNVPGAPNPYVVPIGAASAQFYRSH